MLCPFRLYKMVQKVRLRLPELNLRRWDEVTAQGVGYRKRCSLHYAKSRCSREACGRDNHIVFFCTQLQKKRERRRRRDDTLHFSSFFLFPPCSLFFIFYKNCGDLFSLWDNIYYSAKNSSEADILHHIFKRE